MNNNTPNRLYHGTSFDGLYNILLDGVISAKRGGQHGETYGVNWFFTTPKDNFAKGVIISIDAYPDDFQNYNFKFMNNSCVVGDNDFYSEIPIEGRNMRIEKYGSIDDEILSNIIAVCQKRGKDVFDMIHHMDSLNRRYEDTSFGYLTFEDCYVSEKILNILFKQVGRQDLLREAGFIDETKHEKLEMLIKECIIKYLKKNCCRN